MDTSTTSSASAPAASGDKIKRCRCGSRMSRTCYDSHLLCTNCRGVTCNLEARCDECQAWSREQMTRYLKHKASLLRKRKSRTKTKTKQQHHTSLGLGLSSAVESSSAEMLSSDNAEDSDNYSIAENISRNQVPSNFFLKRLPN